MPVYVLFCSLLDSIMFCLNTFGILHFTSLSYLTKLLWHTDHKDAFYFSVVPRCEDTDIDGASPAFVHITKLGSIFVPLVQPNKF